jgi:hypothetical protein
MKRKETALTVTLALIVSMVSPMPLAKAHFLPAPAIQINSPHPSFLGSYHNNSITLEVEVRVLTGDPDITCVRYSLDGIANVTLNSLSKTDHVWFAPGKGGFAFWTSSVLDNLAEGNHTLKVYSQDTAGREMSASVEFTVDTGYRYPEVLILSPQNKTYVTAELPLTYTSLVVNNKIYMISSGLTQIYDAEKDNWTLGAPSPSFTYVLSSGATTGVFAPQRIYVFTADNDGIDWQSSPRFKTQIYDPQTNRWGNSTIMPNGRFGLSVAVLNDKLYLIGGYTVKPDKPPYLNMKFVTSSENDEYTPNGYGTVPPAVSIVSPENKTYASGNVPLALTMNKPVDWVGYSLDGKANVTIIGNTTLTAVSSGLHNITVYAKDSLNNTGISETVTFNIAKPEPFPTTLVIASVATVAIIGLGLLVYFRKRNHARIDRHSEIEQSST